MIPIEIFGLRNDLFIEIYFLATLFRRFFETSFRDISPRLVLKYGGEGVWESYTSKNVFLALENDLFDEKRYPILFDTVRTPLLSAYDIPDDRYSQPCP